MLFAVGLDGLAVVAYGHSGGDPSPVLARMAPDFYCVCAVSASISVVARFMQGRRLLILLFSAKALLVLLVGIPLMEVPLVRALLVSSALLEMVVYLAWPMGMILAGALATVSVALQGDFYVWGLRLTGPTLGQELQFLSSLCLTFLGATVFRILLDRMTALKDLADGLETTVSRLVTANRRFQDYAQSAGMAAEREERKRISRDIHDTVGYTLTNLIVMMESATDFSRVDPDRAEDLLERARDLAVKGLEDTRRSLRLLRSADTGAPAGLKMIQLLVDTFSRATWVEIIFEYGNMPWSLGDELDEAVYHVVQESLINAFRHGRAHRIRILFWLGDAGLRLSIADDGRGAAVIKEGIGFQGIQERLRKFGGIFTAASTEEGFVVCVEVPAAAVKVEHA